MSIRGVGFVLVMFVLAVAFSSFASYSATTINPKHHEEIDGAKLAKQNCAGCHGQDFKGSGKAPDLHDRGSKLSQEAIAQIIRDGVGDMPAMAGGNLKEDKQVTAIAKYITELDKQK